MKHIPIAALLILFLSCAPDRGTRAEVWIAGFAIDCIPDDQATQCLYINRNVSFDEGEWELLPAGISGFSLEEGFLQRIEVIQNIEEAASETDAPVTRYEFVKQLEKLKDKRTFLNGKWRLTILSGEDLGEEQSTPSLEISLAEMKVYGYDGCNQYFGTISALTSTQITLQNLGSTRKMCADMDVPDRYLEALWKVGTYQLEDQRLVLMGNSGEVLLTMSKVD